MIADVIAGRPVHELHHQRDSAVPISDGCTKPSISVCNLRSTTSKIYPNGTVEALAATGHLVSVPLRDGQMPGLWRYGLYEKAQLV